MLQAKIPLKFVEKTMPWSRYLCYTVDEPMPEQMDVPCRKQHCVDIPGVHSCEEQ